MPKKRVALYARVSTDTQTVANQLEALQEVASRHGWDIVATFTDEAISGAKGRDKRPAFDQLCRGISKRDFDLVAVWSVDRLGRSLQDLIGFLGDVQEKGVDLYMHKQDIDTSTRTGKMMFQMLGVFAEFERGMIQDRVHAGLDRARAAGKKLGRPGISDEQKAAVRAAKASGKTLRAIAAEVGLSLGAVHGALAESA